MNKNNRVVSLAAREAAKRSERIDRARDAYHRSKARTDAESVLRTDLVFADRRTRRGTDVRQRRDQVGVRLLPEEMEQLRRAAERERVSPAEILRRAFLALPHSAE